MKTVTFDFDNTLSRTDVQEYAKKLIGRGFNVWVLTSRYDDNHKHRYQINPSNEDLYKVINALGIPKHKVRFMCMEEKYKYIEHTNIIWHLDDDDAEIFTINEYTKTIGVDVCHDDWEQQCEKLLR